MFKSGQPLYKLHTAQKQDFTKALILHCNTYGIILIIFLSLNKISVLGRVMLNSKEANNQMKGERWGWDSGGGGRAGSLGGRRGWDSGGGGRTIAGFTF